MSSTSDKLLALRAKIDATDKEILQLLKIRAALAYEVGETKKQTEKNPVFYRPEREREVLEQLGNNPENPFKPEQTRAIFREIMSACRALEADTKVACLGPAGTFSEAAVYQQFGSSVQVFLAASIAEVFQKVERGEAEYAVVPIENSTEGMVNLALDSLAMSNLHICAEVFLKVEQNLISHCRQLAEIKKVYSHSQSLAQCRKWLNENLAQAEVFPVSSNAEAVKMAACEQYAAAIAGKFAAEKYEIAILAENIADRYDNTTRFVVISKQKVFPCKENKNNKTSIIFSTENVPGALMQILQPIWNFGINMSKIESRPNPQKLWEYLFFIDLDGHQDNLEMQKLLAEIASKAKFFKILGSYPKGF
ncbi:MAG: prephenate dehydratase [Cardiobacteriaceae bacterium]|nr:prephenate dehydratase [Cardiobacteriaceae bacterium]